MDTKLAFDLVSPEAHVLSSEAEMVTLPGVDGDFSVLAGHAPVIAMLRPGIIVVTGADVPHDRIVVRGGFAEVTPAGLTVLAEEAVPPGELDLAALDQAIKDAEEDVADAKDDEARARGEESLNRVRQLREGLLSLG